MKKDRAATVSKEAKIYHELVAIKKELQAIRGCLEFKGIDEGFSICQELENLQERLSSPVQ